MEYLERKGGNRQNRKENNTMKKNKIVESANREKRFSLWVLTDFGKGYAYEYTGRRFNTKEEALRVAESHTRKE